MNSYVNDQQNSAAARQFEYSTSVLITFVVPSYNAGAYMDHCVKSILDGAADALDTIELIIVDDGSTGDDTSAKADAWHALHPHIIKAVHQENSGHGGAINTGLKHARGKYFKVVDADDWLNEEALSRTLVRLKWLAASELDMMVTNYVYEKPHEGKSKSIRYKSVMPTQRIFGWEDVGHFSLQQNLIMHAVIYRTQILRNINLQLPTHTFYVDNIFAYVPLPAVKSIYYLDVDLYRYFIGREGQSVNEEIMLARIDQQLKITRIMIDAFELRKSVTSKRLCRYMIHYLTMMMTICSVFLRMSDKQDAEDKRQGIWAYLKEHDSGVYPKIRGGALGLLANLPGKGGRALSTQGYKIAQKLFKFN